jgi:hypothetical protein
MPAGDVVFSKGCMRDIEDFIGEIS